MNANVSIPIGKCFDKRSIVATVTVTGVKWWMLRMRTAVALIRLACWVSPVGIDIEHRGDL